MDVLILAAIITAFLAGLAALFAPCCIGVLLPAYFGSVFRQKKTIILMTFIFFLGILVVFLPLGMGIGFLGELFKDYHNIIYLLTGILFLILSFIILFGFHFSFSFHSKKQIKVIGGSSVFTLGILSGLATLCCAPVLAGAMALSALPGSIFWGSLYSIIYALGMVFPLFVISYFLDKKDLMKKFNTAKKRITYSIFKKEISISIANLFSGILFLFMGILLLYLTAKNKITMEPSDFQMNINIFISRVVSGLNTYLESFIWSKYIIYFVLIFLILGVYKILQKLKKDK